MPLLNTAIIERPINPNNIIALFEKKRVGKRLVCAICKARLDNLEGTKTIWICSNCSQNYGTSIQDAPIKDLNESKVKTYPELGKYPTFDERDVVSILPFVEGIDPDADGDNISGKISQEVKCLVWLYDVSIRNADIITSDSGYEEYYTEGDLYFHECTNVDLLNSSQTNYG